MLSPDILKQCAQRLNKAEKERVQIRQISLDFPEIEIDDAGETETNLEYLTIDWFINDYMALIAGKFLSPIGQFRQNLHPSWINKLPSASRLWA